MTKREKKYHQRKKELKEWNEMHWLCVCGHFEESPYRCSMCGNEPPWGCDDSWDDDDIEPEPFGFECIGCGHIQDYPGECDICTGYCVEPMY